MSAPTPATPGSRRRGPVAGAVVVAVVAVGVGGGALAASWDFREAAEVGSQREVRPSWPLDGTATEVRLPDGAISVRLTGARTELPPDPGEDEATEQAPEGGGFVGLEVTRTETAGVLRDVPGLDAEVPAPTYTLLVTEPVAEGGDEETAAPEVAEYPLEAPTDGEGLRTWVAVEGVPTLDDLGLAVEVDGVTQRVDPSVPEVDAGDAEQLYVGPDGPTYPDCGRLRPQAGFETGAEGSCQTRVWSTPYLPGVGWADDARWLVVVAGRPSVPLYRPRGGGDYAYSVARTDPDEPPPGLLLDGEAPAEVVTEGGAGELPVVAWRVDEDVSVPPGRLRVDWTLPLTTFTDPDPLSVVRLTTTVALPALD